MANPVEIRQGEKKCDTAINLYQVLPFLTHLGVLFKWPFQGLSQVTSIWGMKGSLGRSWYCLFFLKWLFTMKNHHLGNMFFSNHQTSKSQISVFLFKEFHGRFIYRVFGANICVCYAATPTFFEKVTHKHRMVVSNMFYFHPYLRKIPILTNIFQMGWWNHQLVMEGLWSYLYLDDCFSQGFGAPQVGGRILLSISCGTWHSFKKKTHPDISCSHGPPLPYCVELVERFERCNHF